MNIKANLVTPRNGVPLIAATQDFITASFLISRRDTFFDRAQFCQIVSYFSDAKDHIDLPPPTILRPTYLWTGKQVFNVLMRPNKKSNVLVNLEASCRTHEKAPPEYIADMSPNDGYLVIVNSEIMCGVFDKNTVGDGKKNSVFAVMQRDYGADEAAAAMGRLAKVCARWLSEWKAPSSFPLEQRVIVTSRAECMLPCQSSQPRLLHRYQRRHAGSPLAGGEGEDHPERVR